MQPNNPTPDAMVEVVDIDRETARKVYLLYGHKMNEQDPFLSGQRDKTPLVQLIARHRLAALTPPAGSFVEGVEAARGVTNDEICRIFAMRAFDSAIRNGSTGLRSWCEANGVVVSHASEFANGLREPCNDLLTALGLERVTHILPVGFPTASGEGKA